MYKALIIPMAGAALLFGAGIASAETSSKTTTTTTHMAPAPANSATKNDAGHVTLTDAQAKSWVNKPVYSNDGKQIGEVVSFKRGADNAVLEMHADIGGMLGIGETRVMLTPQQFTLQTDRVVLDLTQDQAKNLPKVKN